jgi:hypothetical protein
MIADEHGTAVKKFDDKAIDALKALSGLEISEN